jgi:hypothetical protein
MADMKTEFAGFGVAPERIYTEIFNGGESMTSVSSAPRCERPTRPRTTPLPVRWSRSRAAELPPTGSQEPIRAFWNWPKSATFLYVGHAAPFCHNCESGMLSGTVVYEPEPLDKPAAGNVLVCCSRPASDVVIDL